ncbi:MULTISPECIES: NADH-quinone oxidoreductase subunit H [Stakelama]|uniref:NADH dehydrogenase subunit H n=2 Tax=Stakelama TaxID=1124625 RepID=A0A4R6FVN0_9SPHN|nr:MULTISPECIES: NADH-quinone oxidoreductase subunit H [Stakelama]TDN85350.1 NADH dehydrogenase subunit H [Stakelama pacifica]WNO53526.1 NADH-quinone oxidoreductase subunit H [Stakelama sp. W311]GGO92909.1 hypothetical protein GCM10011329_11110 [Stakelama pacifica]
MTALIAVLLLLAAGIWFGATADAVAEAAVAGHPVRAALTSPFRRAALMLSRQAIATEHPDRLNRLLAPACYLVLAAAGLSVIPFAPGMAVTDIATGLVLWGACEALVVVVVFLNGWSANAPLPLIGGYRYVAIGLPAMLISMFVLIGAALPAQSLGVGAVVESQRVLINAVRQPLGLPLFLLLGLSITLRGPFDYGDSADLAGGTHAEASGAHRLLWRAAKLAMLTAFSAMAATVFLGGYLGTVLPGPAWLVLKTALVMLVLVAITHLVARVPPARMLTWLWTVLLPLSFVDLVWAGLEAMR